MEAYIKKRFSDDKSLPEILDATTQTKLLTILGQTLDMNTNTVEECTMERYKEIVRLKTSHYSFYAPMQIALLMTDTQYDTKDMELLRNICYKLGHFFQVQDDFLDCYGDESITGKKGRDIPEGKCTWPLVTALSDLNLDTPQYKTLKANYGQSDGESERQIRAVYDSLQVKEQFFKFQEHELQEMTSTIDSLNSTSISPVLHVLHNQFGMLYNRQT